MLFFEIKCGRIGFMKEEIKALAVYTTEEVAKLLGLNIQTVRKYTREGKIKAKLTGKVYRVSGQAILDFMQITTVNQKK